MQQHRVVCIDSFEEPAVGVVYVTNFRIIFNGSPVSVRFTCNFNMQIPCDVHVHVNS